MARSNAVSPRHMLRLTILVVMLGTLALGGCSSGKSVQRIDTDTQVDLSGNWNDTDSRQVSEAIIDQALSDGASKDGWLDRFQAVHNRRPVVIVGTVRNRTSEHIDTRIFTTDLEKAFVNSGRVRVVADRGERGDVRDEREQQQDWSDPATIKQMGRELGADYMLIGAVSSIVDQEGGEQITFYQTDVELVDIETNEKVWFGGEKIKKYIGRKGYKT